MRLINKHNDHASVLNWWLIGATILAALIYIIGSIYKGFAMPHGIGQNLNSMVLGSPRGAIILCFALAAGSAVLLPEIELGRILSGISLVGIVLSFYFWWDKTAAIQTNAGLENYHATNWIQNYLIGGGWLDVIGLVLALGLIVWYGFDFVKTLRNYSYHPSLLRPSK